MCPKGKENKVLNGPWAPHQVTYSERYSFPPDLVSVTFPKLKGKAISHGLYASKRLNSVPNSHVVQVLCDTFDIGKSWNVSTEAISDQLLFLRTLVKL